MFSNIQPEKLVNMLVGIGGIYVCYFVAGLLHESLIKDTFLNSTTGTQEVFTYPLGFLIFPTGFAWLTGLIVNSFTDQVNPIPAKNLIMSSSMVLISTITYTIAIYITNFPIVTMVKSCNILSVVLVGLCCTRVGTHSLKLTNKKLITGGIITIGILMYNFLGKTDQKTKKDQGDKLLGFPLLVISLIADGFLPDFQAEIKSKYKPRPLQMFQHINKWVCWLSIICSVLYKFQIYPMIVYMLEHPKFDLYLLGMSAISTVGQIFVYRMIKQFKQHVVPFVITTRKIITVLLSIVFFHHSSTWLQMLGVAIVFITVCVEFLTELKKDEHQQVPSAEKANQHQLDDVQPSNQNNSRNQNHLGMIRDDSDQVKNQEKKINDNKL